MLSTTSQSLELMGIGMGGTFLTLFVMAVSIKLLLVLGRFAKAEETLPASAEAAPADHGHADEAVAALSAAAIHHAARTEKEGI